ncbi:hypothetical protein [Nocardia sp. MW-W600-9]
MFDSDTEDAVLAASPDTGEAWFEATKGPADDPDNGVGTRGIDRTDVSSLGWAQKALRTHGTGFPGPATMRVLDVVPYADGTMMVRYHVGWDANLTDRP